jgi:hypothetical protein
MNQPISQEQAQEMLKTLKAIDRRARTTYKERPGHDEDVAMIGMMAENAIINVDEGYDGKLNN